jgi:hypothetical protein
VGGRAGVCLGLRLVGAGCGGAGLPPGCVAVTAPHGEGIECGSVTALHGEGAGCGNTTVAHGGVTGLTTGRRATGAGAGLTGGTATGGGVCCCPPRTFLFSGIGSGMLFPPLNSIVVTAENE